jgi:hypothetical protein
VDWLVCKQVSSMFGLSTVVETVCPKKLASQTQKNKKTFLCYCLTDSFSKDFKMPIGKLTASLQLQEFSLRNLPVSSSTTTAPRSPRRSHPSKSGGLWIVLNIDDTPIVSKSHTHPSHSLTSCLLTSSLSLGVPVPHSTQCM